MELKQEAPLYRAAAHSAGAFDKSSVADYTEAMLTWWRMHQRRLVPRVGARYGAPYPRGWFDLSVISVDKT